MIRIHCADAAETSAAWRMLAHVPDDTFQPAELHLDGHGPLYQVVRDSAGDLAARPPAQQARSCQR